MFTSLWELLLNQPPGEFLRGKLVFAGRLPGELRLALLLAVVGATWLLYRRAAAKTSPRIHRTVLTLRIILIGLLAFILGAPSLRSYAPSRDRLFTAVLVDTSRSMRIADVASTAGPISRVQAAGALLYPSPGGPGLLADISRDSQVIVYEFSESARRAGPRTLDEAAGSFTNIFRAVRDVEAELRAVPLAAMVLVTDGCRNTGGSTADAARLLQARGVPLFTVGVGDPHPPKDLEVLEVAAPRQVRRDSEVELDVTVRYTGCTKPFDVQLKRENEILLTHTLVPKTGADLERVRLLFTPDHEGTCTYRVEIPVTEEETIPENNARDFVLEIRDDRLPVLYIEGSPRMEYRFLRRALFRDKTFRLVGLLRLAADRFYIQGANDAESYLKDGFPDTPERLAAFQAIILGDVEAGLFTPKQMSLLEDFVKRRGGGLLMLGGVNSFGLGGYAKTPVGAMLPLQISPHDPPYSDEQFLAEPIADNLQHPVMRLSSDPVENKLLWHNAPPLIGITPLAGVKPGAALLLDRPGSHNPVLAVQNYGEGRVAGFTSGGSWYWRVSKPASDAFHERFWKQLIRWLVVGAKEQLSVSTDAEIYARRDPVTIRALVLGQDMQPVNDAPVSATVTDPVGNTQQIPLDWILSQEGVYQCRFVPDAEGQYQVSVAVKGWETPAVVRAFMVAEPQAEFANAGMKPDALADMAAITNGKYFDLSQADEMAEEIRRGIAASANTVADPQDKPLWNMPLVFVLLISLAGAEWLVRRRNGLA